MVAEHSYVKLWHNSITLPVLHLLTRSLAFQPVCLKHRFRFCLVYFDLCWKRFWSLSTFTPVQKIFFVKWLHCKRWSPDGMHIMHSEMLLLIEGFNKSSVYLRLGCCALDNCWCFVCGNTKREFHIKRLENNHLICPVLTSTAPFKKRLQVFLTA